MFCGKVMSYERDSEDTRQLYRFFAGQCGTVIRYRLRKEILEDLTPGEEERLLEQIYELPQFKLVQSYVKLDGYIGSGMHSCHTFSQCIHADHAGIHEKLEDGGKRESAGGGVEPHKRHHAAGQ